MCVQPFNTTNHKPFYIFRCEHVKNNLTPAQTRLGFSLCLLCMSQTLPFFSKPLDFSLPNSSWGPEMMRLYEHYNGQCEVEREGGEKQKGPWRRLPSYNRVLKYATGTNACSLIEAFIHEYNWLISNTWHVNRPDVLMSSGLHDVLTKCFPKSP